MGRTYEVEHDFAEEHVLQSEEGVGVILRAHVLEGLKEVRVCGRVVLVFRVEDTGLQVELGLEVWWAVYGVGSCA